MDGWAGASTRRHSPAWSGCTGATRAARPRHHPACWLCKHGRSLAAPALLSQPLVTPKKFAPRLQICNLAVGQGGFSPPTIRRMPIQLAQAHALVAQFVELQPTPLAHHRKRVVKNVF